MHRITVFRSIHFLIKHRRDVWYTIGVSIIEGVGGEFTINGTNAGNISAEDANIPVGDFGSNDCYTSGDACDELYIARMGAGCDCYYFEGIIDEVKISFVQDGEWEPASHWTFWEGEGGDTGDALNNGHCNVLVTLMVLIGYCQMAPLLPKLSSYQTMNSS